MRNRIFGFLAVVVLVLLVSGSAQAQDQDDWGYNIAGSWLGEGSFTLDFDCDGLVNPEQDPTFLFSDAHTFGVGGSVVTTNPGNPNSHNGTWTKTGPRQFFARNLVFGPDNDEDGLFDNWSVISWTVDFEKGFESATGMFTTEVYVRDPVTKEIADPLDPASVPFPCAVGQHDSLRKISATD